jgi:hypothetical protein
VLKPKTSDVPEFLPEAEFARRFGRHRHNGSYAHDG